MNSSKGWQFATRQIIQFLCALVLLSVLLFVTPGWAMDAASGKQVIIAAGQVINDDLYLAGETILLNGTVKGDAVLAAREITVNGTVEGDLIAAGQVITLNGSVGDDARLAGQALILQPKARIADDAIAAGFSLENQAGSTVGGDLSVFANQALLAGTVKQDAIAATNALELRGNVGRNMRVIAVGDPHLVEIPFIPQPPVTLAPVKSGFTLTDTAQIGGKVNYKSTVTANISPKAKITGGIVGEQLEHRTAPASPVWAVIWQIQRLLALFLVGWLLLRFVPHWTQNLAQRVKSRPLANLGWGILVFVAVGIAAIAIATVTVLLTILFAITLPSLIPTVLGLGLVANLALAVSFVAFASFVPQIVLSLLAGRWLLQKLQPNTPTQQLLALGIGLLGFVLLTAIPVLGAIVTLIAIFLSLGALSKQFTNRNHQLPTTNYQLPTTNYQ
jgi:cytoskeletal protein CcmA (bactofilin family)